LLLQMAVAPPLVRWLERRPSVPAPVLPRFAFVEDR